MRASVRNGLTVRLCLPDVPFHCFDIDTEHSADETATSIVNVNLGNRVNVELLRHCRFPVNDINLPQRNLGVTPRHLL